LFFLRYNTGPDEHIVAQQISMNAKQ
jgi:hypothetical protein